MAPETNDNIVCRVKNLTVHYDVYPSPIVAVNDVSFDAYGGETLGLVGESGCGKTTTAMAMLRLLQTPGRVVGGSVVVDGTDIMKLNAAALRRVSGNGLLATASCSQHEDKETFRQILSRASYESGRRVRQIFWGGQAKDHPVRLSMPETDYLKFAILHVS